MISIIKGKVYFHHLTLVFLGNAEALKTGNLDANILKISIWRDKMGKIWTLDHRRLAAFKLAGKCVPYRWATKKEVKNNLWKMTTKTKGKSIKLKTAPGESIHIN